MEDWNDKPFPEYGQSITTVDRAENHQENGIDETTENSHFGNTSVWYDSMFYCTCQLLPVSPQVVYKVGLTELVYLI